MPGRRLMSRTSVRRSAYFTVRPELTGELVPHTAGWYVGESPWSSIDSGPLRLAAGARRFDVSRPGTPGSPPPRAVGMLADLRAQSLYRHAMGLANRFRTGIGLEPGNSAILSLPSTTPPQTP
jgi:hypothetical protein